MASSAELQTEAVHLIVFGSKTINKIKTAFSDYGITFAPDPFCQVSFFFFFFRKSTSGKITN